MSFCRHCGNQLGESDRFCPSCGAEVANTGVASAASADTRTTASSRAPKYEYKGVGIRFVAHLIDAILVFVVYLVVGRIIAGVAGGTTDSGFDLQGIPAFLLMLITFVVSMGYFIILEAKWNGQTLGKKMVGIRVIAGDGGDPGIQQTTVRNLLRIVDLLPFFYLLGIILIWTGGKKQRLGDRVADTVVVRAVARRPE